MFTSNVTFENECFILKSENKKWKMSIFIENVSWSQTDRELIIKLPIQGKKITDNVIITEKFMKVNIQPYYYELFFEGSICPEESTCKILESCIKCILKKSNDGLWQTLGKPSKVNGKLNEKCSLNELRKETRAEYEQKVKEQCNQKRVERRQLEREVLDKRLDRDARIRAKIENTQKSLKEQQLRGHITTGNVKNAKLVKPDVLVKPPMAKESRKPEPKLPPVRSFGSIDVTFSERRFITPKRESQDQAEREWCAKQHEIMTKNVGFCDENLNDDERDAIWLLNKGREFLGKKNYLGAVSAFSSGIKIANESADLLLGRAQAHFHLENFQRCVSFHVESQRMTLSFYIFKFICRRKIVRKR